MKAKFTEFLDIMFKSINEFKMLLYGVFMYLHIDVEAISILATLMCIDTFCGSIKVFRIDYTGFKFKKLLLGFVSKVAFILIPLVVALAGKGLGYQLKMIVEISIKILVCSETISIISNLIAIKTKKDVQDYDIITALLKYLRNAFIKISEALLSNLREEK